MNVLKGLVGGQYKPLAPKEVEKIHNTSMEIIETVGIEINDERALQILKDNGAEVDFNKKIARADRTWVMDKVDKAPSEICLYGREEKHDLQLGDKRVYLGTGGTALNVLDLETGKKRPSNLQDVKRAARIVDALDNIHFLVIPLYPTELSKENVDVNRFFAGLENTTKHIMGGIYSRKGMLEVIKMAEMIAGGEEALRKRPFISFITCVMSPLKFDATYTDLMITAAEKGIPVAVPAEPLCGATAPVTLAGVIAQLNAETLFGVALTQVVNPGTPVLYGNVGTVVDMSSITYLSGAVEMGLINAGAAQMAQYYKLPYYATAGMSDAKIPDCQSGYERAITALMVALAGANYIHDAAGLLEFAMTVSYEQYVIDNEIIGMVMRALKGIEVNDESLALDVVKKVGPAGNFLIEEHTVKHLRNEFFFPQLSDRQKREDWERNGSLDTWARAKKKALEILNNHQPKAIPEDVKGKIKREIKGFIDEPYQPPAM